MCMCSCHRRIYDSKLLVQRYLVQTMYICILDNIISFCLFHIVSHNKWKSGIFWRPNFVSL
jgi:hypothetical protein